MKLTNLAPKFIQFVKNIDLEDDKEYIYQLFKSQFQTDVYYQIILSNIENNSPDPSNHLYQYLTNFNSIKEQFFIFSDKILEILESGMSTFQTYFKDFKISSEIQVGHSLGSFDGGMRRGNNGELYLLFGFDIMAQLYKENRAGPFIIHELFHDYHNVHYQQLNDENILDALWKEGLATYMSKTIYPDANRGELLLSTPSNMIERTYENIVSLSTILLNNLEIYDNEIYSQFFTGPFSETNYRAGYYLGFLLADSLSNEYSQETLVKLSGNEILPLAKQFLNNCIDDFASIITESPKL